MYYKMNLDLERTLLIGHLCYYEYTLEFDKKNSNYTLTSF